MTKTLFAQIIEGTIPADIVFENERIMAFRDIQPQAPTHILIIPKKAIPTINDVVAEDAQLLGEMVLVARQLAAKEAISERGYRLVMNCNEDGGQSVFHIHLHLLGGRPLGWPPG